VIHTGKRNLTFNVLCLICFGFRRDIASLTKRIPQAVAASHNLQVGSVLPATIRAPAGVMRSNAAPVFARVAKSSEGWPVLPEENNAIKATYCRRRLTENELCSVDLESRFYAVLSKAAQVA
jgi:hypothetical protein